MFQMAELVRSGGGGVLPFATSSAYAFLSATSCSTCRRNSSFVCGSMGVALGLGLIALPLDPSFLGFEPVGPGFGLGRASFRLGARRIGLRDFRVFTSLRCRRLCSLSIFSGETGFFTGLRRAGLIRVALRDVIRNKPICHPIARRGVDIVSGPIMPVPAIPIIMVPTPGEVEWMDD